MRTYGVVEGGDEVSHQLGVPKQSCEVYAVVHHVLCDVGVVRLHSSQPQCRLQSVVACSDTRSSLVHLPRRGKLLSAFSWKGEAP